jgi:tetratricopeptide (TPR) repeat protein
MGAAVHPDGRSHGDRPPNLAPLLSGAQPPAAAEQFRFLGTALLDLGRRAEALAAFDEALEAEPLEAVNWLWRALTFPQSAQARDDAAFAMRLRPALRHDASLDQSFPAGYRPLLRGLRDEVAPQGARLATLVGEGACASCPEFCQAARRKAEVRLWAVEGANHPIAESFFRSRIGAREGAGPFLAIDEHYALGCGKIFP